MKKTCSKDNPMPIEEGDKAVQNGITWLHEDVSEIEDLDRFVMYKCNSCGYIFTVDFGD